MIFPHSFSGGCVIDIYSYENKISLISRFLGGKNSLSGKIISIYFNPYFCSHPFCPLQCAAQSTNRKNPKTFFHSFRMCIAHKKSKFSYCGFIRRFFNYNVAYSLLQRAFFCVLFETLHECVCVFDQTRRKM